MRRHWDLNPKPLEFVNWFLQDWRRAADKVKAIVETRVQNYQNSWNSYFRALVPPETGIFKRPTNESYKLVRANPGTMRRTHKGMSLYPRRKKRQFDEIDRISELRRMRLRNRFSELERDTEARSKTVQSLMAAGVREVKRADRIAYLQRIVRTLNSFKVGPSKTTFEKEMYLSQLLTCLLYLQMRSTSHPG
ncbi:unnamed protein product [Gongylonema pulchrum]|uniref:Uncharacterized protein n=1 Tax=Gongylonema pulchrum TaxID=637853 RepID=A0A3P7NBS1_9BILA|nr:unnamed protein product [Gongylonema pulchrum]